MSVLHTSSFPWSLCSSSVSMGINSHDIHIPLGRTITPRWQETLPLEQKDKPIIYRSIWSSVGGRWRSLGSPASEWGTSLDDCRLQSPLNDPLKSYSPSITPLRYLTLPSASPDSSDESLSSSLLLRISLMQKRKGILGWDRLMAKAQMWQIRGWHRTAGDLGETGISATRNMWIYGEHREFSPIPDIWLNDSSSFHTTSDTLHGWFTDVLDVYRCI